MRQTAVSEYPPRTSIPVGFPSEFTRQRAAVTIEAAATPTRVAPHRANTPHTPALNAMADVK